MGEEPPQEYKSNNSKITIEEPKKSGGSFFIVKLAKVEIVSDIEECKKLWLEFSPMKNLFDTWEFRYAFYLAYKYKPYFLVLRKNGENLACLPLWYEDNNFYDKNLKRFTWFGSDWQEENKFFAKSIDYVPILLSLAPTPLYLNAISKDMFEQLKGKVNLEED